MTATGFAPAEAEGILLRDGGMCSMDGFPPCPGGMGATDPGHRLNRGQGGDRRAFVNSTANGAAQHHGCNWRLEQHGDFAEEGRRRGCKLDHSDDDETTVLTTPMWSPFFHQWLTLDRAGAHLTGITDRTLDARRAAEWLR